MRPKFTQQQGPEAFLPFDTSLMKRHADSTHPLISLNPKQEVSGLNEFVCLALVRKRCIALSPDFETIIPLEKTKTYLNSRKKSCVSYINVQISVSSKTLEAR